MFRCLECGGAFDEPKEIIETHGLDTPPYEKFYVCPKCGGHGYKPFIKDSFSRREVLDKLVDIMQALNEFDDVVCKAFNGCATDGTRLDDARCDIFKLLTILAGDDEFDLPFDTDDKIFSMLKPTEVKTVFDILTKNIEE